MCGYWPVAVERKLFPALAPEADAARLQTLLRLRIPSALPYFFGGLRISSGLALIGAVVAEFVAGTGGTGALHHDAPRLRRRAAHLCGQH